MALHLLRGQRAERLAKKFLIHKGHRLLAQNYHCKVGELDLVTYAEGVVIFIEVRFRTKAHYGQPYETITYSKQQKLLRAARHFLQHHPQWQYAPLRFDIISIDRQHQVTWLQNAFGD